MRRPLSFALLALLTLVVAPSSGYSASAGAKATPGRVMEPREFDRLDGHGATGKKVDVIEWEGNLEIHVYPKGSLKSLGMKIDRESKTTKNAVMVIEYAFNGVPYTLIRRAVLSISLPDSFQAFKDETADDYDKIMVSGHTLAGVKTYALAPAPTQLYPDYHPALAQDDDSAPGAAGEPAKTYQRKSASEPTVGSGGSNAPGIKFQKADELEDNGRGTVRRRRPKADPSDDEGGIRNFAF
ncbi:MAG: hypothetical protein JST04_02795 [Bdellovibrionales bacterium]|nr:hypothetical protein [Bdellovibrionales bacterium]